MAPVLMSNSQHWSVRLETRAVFRVPATDHARWLTVSAGRLWLTADGDLAQPSEDVWLRPGEGCLLPAGADAVVEGDPQARFQLVEAVLSRRQRGVFLRRWVREARRAWLTAPPQPSGASCTACAA